MELMMSSVKDDFVLSSAPLGKDQSVEASLLVGMLCIFPGRRTRSEAPLADHIDRKRSELEMKVLNRKKRKGVPAE